jgi:alkanesulfonate monooxygenase SsuD/methylene tetrahydromethanopterin reductase-like flavin-dependent oxidoreductase (luciferase family)
VEFGIFIQGYNPAFRRGDDPVEAEHRAFMDELAAVQAADKAGFKYVWITEHHFLDEYSHLSANDVVCGYLAHATERIHIGSGIFNPLPQVNHPAKVAERVAMLDHLSNGRFEFGTGRGAGSHEILGFLPEMRDLTHTREIWEDVIAEFPKMWLQDTYEGYQGKYWSLPPRKILPKPYKAPHPAMWYAAGNSSSWEMAAKKGLGILGFSVSDFEGLAPVLSAYKNAIGDAEPIGAFVNDNVMITTAASVNEDENKALAEYVRSRPMYLVSNVFRYHDTFPAPDGTPKWPDTIPDLDAESAKAMMAAGGSMIGNPDQVLAACQRWADAGVDQLALGIGPAAQAETLETIRLFGEHIIPKLDTDPMHRTDRFKEAAVAKSATKK